MTSNNNNNHHHSSWTETTTPTVFADRKMAIEKLLEGALLTTQLQQLINQPQLIQNNELYDVEDLVMKISNSFSDTISILNSDETDEVSFNPANSSLCGDGRKSEDSGDSSRSSTLKDRRGCYKRRKSANSWTRITQTLIDDGHAWRKYGQKQILNATQPRNYFRCTHKHDQGCLATKQVQKTEDIENPMFTITYNGQHTCKTLPQTPQLIFDPTMTHDQSKSSSVFLDFGSNNTIERNNNGAFNPFMHSSPLSLKKERKHMQLPTDVYYESKKPEYQLSPDMTTYEASGYVSLTSSALGSSEYVGDASSEMRSYDDPEMDFMIELTDLEDGKFEYY